MVAWEYDANTGSVDLNQLQKMDKDEFSAVILAQPNFFGCVEETYKEISGDLYIPSTKKTQLELGLKMSVDESEALQKTIDFYKKMAETK